MNVALSTVKLPLHNSCFNVVHPFGGQMAPFLSPTFGASKNLMHGILQLSIKITM